MIDVYDQCEECAGAFLCGVLYPVSLGGDATEPAFVVACECGEYGSDEDAAGALAEALGPDYRSESVGGGFAVRDGGGILSADGALRALEAASGGSISEVSSSSRSSSSS